MSFNRKAISLGLAVVLAGAVIASGLTVKEIGLKGGEQDSAQEVTEVAANEQPVNVLPVTRWSRYNEARTRKNT